MSTPKPGQIRCPTCLRSTPPAAYCTQCGSPIPPSARIRPRGFDRDELESRVRRRPGEGAFRRGTPVNDADARGGYLPFEPEPEDALAARGEEEAREPRPDHADDAADVTRRQVPAREPAVPPPPYAPVAYDDAEQSYQEPGHAPPEDGAAYYDEEEYGQPEDAYAYPYSPGDRRRNGGGALPIIGFVVLSVLALGVGAVLAGLLGGDDDGVGRASPTPTEAVSQDPSEEPSEEPSVDASPSEGEATPEPTDGPVSFPDGALLTVQPCASNGYQEGAVGRPEEEACQEDGSSVDTGRVWAMVVFRDAGGTDDLRLRLRSNGEILNEQNVQIGSLVSCGGTCSGLIIGTQYTNLLPGQYEVVLHRNGDFADRASFTVEG